MSDLDAARWVMAGRVAAFGPGPRPDAAAKDSRSPTLHRDPVDGVTCRIGDASCAGAHASAIRRRAACNDPGTARALLKLQRRFGNHYVGQVLARSASAEQDAGDLGHVERTIDQARGGGQGLEHSVRRQMESSFGADFSGVRVHTDARADGLNHALSARAFATGQDIFFRQGEYNPGASAGRELLAHELTHVVQQGGGGLARKMTVSQPDDPQEVEADRVASDVMRHEREGGSPSGLGACCGESGDKADEGSGVEAPAPDEHDEEKKRAAS